MTPETRDQVFDQAKMLPDSERAQLAHDLLASLDGSTDLDATTAWDQEIQRRLVEVIDGTTDMVSRDKFMERLARHIG